MLGSRHLLPYPCADRMQIVRGCVCMQYLCKKPSLSGLDRQIFGIFFLWGFVSVLIGGIVGGSVLTAFNPSIVSQPSELLLIGCSSPATVSASSHLASCIRLFRASEVFSL